MPGRSAVLSLACAALVLMLPLPAMAGDGDTCNAQLSSLDALVPPPAKPRIARESDGWCLLDQIAQPVGKDGVLVEIRQLKWRGAGFEEYLATGALPQRIELQAVGVRFGQSRAAEIDLSMDLSRDDATGDLLLHGPNIDLAGENGLYLAGRFAGTDPASANAFVASLGSASLQGLSLRLVSDGRAIDHLKALIAALGDADVRPWRDSLRKSALNQLALLPDTLIDPASRVALQQFLEDMPRVQGAMRIDAQPKAHFPLARFLAFFGPARPRAAPGVARVLDGLAITAAYPAPAAP